MSGQLSEPVDVRVARRLRSARLAAGLTVRDVAARLQLRDHTLVVRYERGDVRPPLERLERLAALYGLSLAALLAAEDALVPLITALEQTGPQSWSAVAALLADVGPD